MRNKLTPNSPHSRIDAVKDAVMHFIKQISSKEYDSFEKSHSLLTHNENYEIIFENKHAPKDLEDIARQVAAIKAAFANDFREVRNIPLFLRKFY